MTNEEIELKNKLYQERLAMCKNGFVIDTDYEINFDKAKKEGTLLSTIEELEARQKEDEQKDAIVDFLTNADYYLGIDKISNLVNGDNFFRNSGEERDNFISLLNELKGPREYASLRNALDNLNESISLNQGELQEAKRNKFRIEHDNSLGILEKSDEIQKVKDSISLMEERKVALSTSKKDLETRMDNMIKELEEKMDVISYGDHLLATINKLDASYRKLSFEPLNSEELASDLRNLRDRIVGFRVKSQEKISEYNRICQSIGIKKVNVSQEEIDKMVKKLEEEYKNIDVLSTSEEKEEVISNDEIITDEVKKEESIDDIIGRVEEPVQLPDPLEANLDESKEEEKVITDVKGLVTEIKKMNPDVKIISKTINEDGKIKEIFSIETDEPDKLKLPEGFNYSNDLGINNKVSDTKPYISVSTIAKTKELAVVDDEIKNSKVPSGRIKIKKIRKAIIAPYVKSVLLYGGLGFVASLAIGAGTAPILPFTLIGTGIGALGQAIYGKMARNGQVNIPEFENTPYEIDPETATWTSSAFYEIKHKSKKLLSAIRDKFNNRNKQETYEDDIHQQLDNLDFTEEDTLNQRGGR